MNKLYTKQLFLIVFLLAVSVNSGNSQIFKKNASRKAEKELYGKSLSRKKAPKVKEPRAVSKAKKKQGKNKRKLDKDYAKSVKKSQKRTYDIQTPEVQERMKQDKKDAAVRDKENKKKSRSSTKKAGKKYK